MSGYVSEPQQRRDRWVKKYEGNLPTATLKVIVADGSLGTAGAYDAKKMTPATADHILRLVMSSGVAGVGRDYLARVIRWHYGYTSGGPTASTAKVSSAEAAFVRKRAHQLVTAHEDSIDGPLIKLVHPDLAR